MNGCSKLKGVAGDAVLPLKMQMSDLSLSLREEDRKSSQSVTLI